MATSAKKLLSQVSSLHAAPLEDIVPLSTDNPFEVDALLFGPAGTPYAHGAFRVRLTYGEDYPAAPPRGLFLTKIFHPNVSARGEICVNTLKRDWTAGVTVSHILMVIKCLLISPGPDSALNEEAGRMLMDSFEEFAKVARMWTSVHAIRVEKALGELEADQRKKVMLSCGTDLAGQSRAGGAERGETTTTVLGASDVNKKPGVHGLPDSGEGEGVLAKKTKTAGDAALKKKVDAKKKTLKRL